MASPNSIAGRTRSILNYKPKKRSTRYASSLENKDSEDSDDNDNKPDAESDDNEDDMKYSPTEMSGELHKQPRKRFLLRD